MRLYNKEEISENKGENDMKKRGFEVAKGFEDAGINLPVRKTKYSAGYDVEAAEDTIIPAFKRGQKPTLVKTGIRLLWKMMKCFFYITEVLIQVKED